MTLLAWLRKSSSSQSSPSLLYPLVRVLARVYHFEIEKANRHGLSPWRVAFQNFPTLIKGVLETKGSSAHFTSGASRQPLCLEVVWT